MKSKKMKSAAITSIVAFALVCSASAATTISYSYYTATSSSDTSWVSPTGSTSVRGVNFGGDQTTFGGVTWLQGANSGDFGQVVTGNETPGLQMNFSAPNQAWALNLASAFYSGGPTLLDAGAYSNLQENGVDYSIGLYNFTVGQEYLVQFVLADTRSFGGIPGRTITLDGYSANIASQDASAYQYAYTDGRFAVVTARFTPGDGDTNFFFRPLIADGAGGLQINAIQVLTIPEPSTALLGGLGLLAMLRRRR